MSRIDELLNPKAYEPQQRDEGPVGRAEPKRTSKGAFGAPDAQSPVKFKTSEKVLTIGEFARFLRGNYGLNIGRQRLYNFFKVQDVFLPASRMPRKKYLDNGMFKVRYSRTTSYRVVEVVPLITPLGQQHWIQDILEAFAV